MYLGAVGLQGTGKSHILKLWQEKMIKAGAEALVVDIAYPLKAGAADIFNITVADVERNKQEFRIFLQEYGRLGRMCLGQDWLIEQAADKAETQANGAIENVRMMNEAIKLNERGWFLFGVQCTDEVRLTRLEKKYGRLPTTEELNHETERDIPDIFKCGIPVFGNDTEQDAELISDWLTQVCREGHL